MDRYPPRNLPEGTGAIVLGDPFGLLSQEAVRHLEPYPHGTWAVTESWDEDFTVAYSGPRGALYYQMYQCHDLEAIHKYCSGNILTPSPRPLVVNQILLSSTLDGLSSEQTESRIIQLPLRPHLPAFDHMGDSIGPTELDQVSRDMESQMVPSSIDTTQVDVSVSNSAIPRTVTLQDTQLPTLGDSQPNSIQNHTPGDLDWAFTNEFLRVGDASGNINNTSVNNGTQPPQLDGNITTSNWEPNWTQMSSADHQAARQPWGDLTPKY